MYGACPRLLRDENKLKVLWTGYGHVWERFAHVWETFGHVWDTFGHVWDTFGHVSERSGRGVGVGGGGYGEGGGVRRRSRLHGITSFTSLTFYCENCCYKTIEGDELGQNLNFDAT